MGRTKNFAAMDKRNTDGAATAALKRRFDDSRISVFDAQVDELASNPENARDEEDPKVEETRGSLTTVGQLQEIRIVTREVFLDAYPEHEDTLPEARWVVIVGNRRLAAARLAGMETLRAQLAPDVASCQDIEDFLIHENVHREDLPPLREAHLYQRKIDRDGISARELATAISKTHTYVNQRLALLRLIPEFQALIRERELGLKESRSLSQLSQEQQHAVYRDGPPYTVQTGPSGNPVSSNGNGSHSPADQLAGEVAPTENHGDHDAAAPDPDPDPSPTATESQDQQTPPQPAPNTSPSLTIRGSTPTELAKSLRSQLDASQLAELVRLLSS